MKKIIVLLFALACGPYIMLSQTNVDFLRFSQEEFGGSARNIALAGSTGASGADFSVASTNPAGLALYRNSDVFITPTLYFSKINSNYLNTNASENRMSLNFNNFGVVFNFLNSETDDWRSVNFSFGVNKLNNYNNFFEISGHNSKNSIITDLINQANGTAPENLNGFSTGLAWESFAFSDHDSLYNYDSELKNGGIYQNRYVEQRGYKDEFLINFAANYKDVLYLGASFAYQYLNYQEESYHTEYDQVDTIGFFDTYRYNNFLETRGGGVNLKLGMIYRPADWVRFGVSFQTPTVLNLNDEYSSSMSVYADDGNTYKAESENGSFSYTINTPMRLRGNISFLINRMFMLSGSYEIVDYSDGKIRSAQYSYIDENSLIINKYKTAHNYNLGLEVNLQSVLLRAGYAYYQSPFADGINDGSRKYMTGGIGFKSDDGLYFDIGYSYNLKEEDFYLYDANLVSPANLEYQRSNFVFSIGKKF